MNITRPMLAAAATNADLDRLRYPLLASPKLDGIRCLVHPTLGPVTRSFKPVPNEYIRKLLSPLVYCGLDGELMCKGADFNSIQSAVMSRAGEPDLEFHVFDSLSLALADVPFHQRMEMTGFSFKDDELIRPLMHIEIATPDEAREFASKCIEQGFEGMVLRDPLGEYKSGRSTLKQQGMVKFKEFQDAEGTVVAFEELYHNQNEQERDAFGLAERSDKKEGMVPGDTLGALVLDTKWGQLRVGTGFDSNLRKAIWSSRSQYLGRTVTFKFQTHGMQDLPRFPVFLRFREAE